eukprot:3636898-Heterocapsa_arctica.AAC.1
MVRSHILAGDEPANVAERRDKHPEQEKEDEYPGVSSQKRVWLRAERLFQEGAAKKATKKQELFDNRQLTHNKQYQHNMEDRENKRFKTSLDKETNQ